MEVTFPLSLYLKNDITKLGSSLLPKGFFGDKRETMECTTRMSSIVTALGESSAKAQGLQKVITSGERLRNSDHTVFILANLEGGQRGYGQILGMIKVGVKHLYLFDSSGNNHEVYANCILDFYVHESKQRMGLGKKLVEFMLQEENVEPRHLAIDKPSPKLLSFLQKHYGLETIIPQMNNFVLFEGFFDNRPAGNNTHKNVMAAGISSSTTRSLSSGLGFSNNEGGKKDSPRPLSHSPTPLTSTPGTPNPYDRPKPHRPVSTMGLILQHEPTRPTTSASSTASHAELEHQDEVDAEIEAQIQVSDVSGNETAEPQEESYEQEPEAEVLMASLVLEVEPESIVREPTPCKLQAATPGSAHIDLKFYHSSLW